jgi:CHAT domain-containing protein
MSNNIDPKLLMRLMSVRSEQELMELLAKHPELMPVLERMKRQAGRTAPSPSAPAQASGGLRAELARAPHKVQQIVRQLAQPVSDLHQQVQRLRLFERALALVDRRRSPQLWAALQNDFAIFLRRIPVGDRADNLEQAIAACEQALQVRTRQAMPFEWSLTMMNLANAYRNRIRGDQADNLEQAIAAYQQVLQVRTRQAMPLEWAETMCTLGIAYANRIRGDRADNFEKAIEAFQQALQVRTRQAMPVEWADAMHNLGNAYYDRIRGDRADNLEQAIAAYQQALQVTTRQAMPLAWAETMTYLAAAYSDRIQGDRADNLEQAIAACQQALQVRTRQATPAEWSTTMTHLAIAYRNRIRGDRADNLEQAIAAYQQILQVRTRQDMTLEWARTMSNLALAYADRIRGDRADNLEQAIAAYQQSLQVTTRQDMPFEWADTMNNLANAYMHRIRGDRADNLEQAIAAYQQVLQVRTRQAMPLEWAETMNNLAAAYTDRIRGDRADNLEQAIAAYQQSLRVMTSQAMPVKWAATMSNLATAYADRIRGDRADNLEQAIAACQQALQVATRQAMPLEWARTMNNLALAYVDRIRGDRADNLEQAIAACQQALQVRTRQAMPMQWANTITYLAITYAKRIRGDRAENLERATAAYQAAIDGAQAIGIRDYERRAAGGLGLLHYAEREWAPAYAAFDTAIAALEAMRTGYFSEEAKTRLAEESALLYTHMTDTCLHLDRPQEAMERAEAGKSRLFLDQLGTDAFLTPSLPAAQKPLLEREANLISELRALEHAIRNAPDEARRRQFVAQQAERRAALDEMWAQLEPHAPDYVALRRGDPIKYEQLQALVDGFDTAAALVEFYTLPDEIIAFVLRSGEKEPAVAQVDITQDQLLHHVQTYWREVVEYPQRGDIGQRWQELAGPLLADVLPHLEKAELIYLVPHGLLHYLPLHALRMDGEYLVDRIPIAYAPSAAVLGRVIQRTVGIERMGQPKALVAGNPTLDLRYAESEAQQVAKLFGAQPYLGERATKATVQSELAGKDVAHLACHGYFYPIHPLQSGVVFAGGERLTAQEIMGLNLQADLVTLSACTTGLTKVSGGDELVGLTRALLYAGASSVLVSLWAVDDESTGQLMTDFYHRLYDDTGQKVKAEAIALREAMLELRKTKEHPYYWAPFILVGDWR